VTGTLSSNPKLYTEPCPRCRGEGYEPGFGYDIPVGAHQPCKRCKGSGEVQWKVCEICEGVDPVGCQNCEGAVRIDL